jgi:hypothetical protein
LVIYQTLSSGVVSQNGAPGILVRETAVQPVSLPKRNLRSHHLALACGTRFR